MEKSLFDLIQDQKGILFSLPVVVDIIMQIVRGMWYLHDLGVAHRDLTPQNVVLNRLIHPHLEDHFRLKLEHLRQEWKPPNPILRHIVELALLSIELLRFIPKLMSKPTRIFVEK